MGGGMGEWVMPDFSLYSAGGQRHSPIPHVGLVLSTCGSAPTIHLQLELCERYFGRHTAGNTGLPVLVVNDGDVEEDALKRLCEHYGAWYRTGPRLGHAPGDLRAFIWGLEWAAERNVSILAKMSRRFIPLVNWRQELVLLADRHRYSSTFGRHHDERGFLRTDCIALRVSSWNVSEIHRTLQETIDNSDVGVAVETVVNSIARVNGGVALWDLVGEHISRPYGKSLQWRGHYPYAYGDLARSLGLPYQDSDFEKGEFVGVPENLVPFKRPSDLAVNLGRSAPKDIVLSPFPVITACDYAMVPLACVLGTTLEQYSPGVFSERVCLVPEGMDDGGLYDLQEAGWTVKAVSEDFGSANFGSVQSAAMLYRNLIPELFPVERVALYMDADTAVRGSLKDILPLAEQMVGFGFGTAALEYCRAGYYNTGVMVMDLDVWREHGIGREGIALWSAMRESGVKNPGVPYDEAALVEAMKPHKVFPLPPQYNTTPGAAECPAPLVYHFRGPKPNDPEAADKFPTLVGGLFPESKAFWQEHNPYAIA